MPTDIGTFLPILSIVLTLATIIGGFFAFRSGYSKQTSEVQEKVINALKAQNETQEAQIALCEKEILRLKQVVMTIQAALKRRGLRIDIENDSIILVDEVAPRHERVVRVQITDKPEETAHSQKTEEKET